MNLYYKKFKLFIFIIRGLMNEMEENTVRILSHARSQPTLFLLLTYLLIFITPFPRTLMNTLYMKVISYMYFLFFYVSSGGIHRQHLSKLFARRELKKSFYWSFELSECKTLVLKSKLCTMNNYITFKGSWQSTVKILPQ